LNKNRFEFANPQVQMTWRNHKDIRNPTDRIRCLDAYLADRCRAVYGKIVCNNIMGQLMGHHRGAIGGRLNQNDGDKDAVYNPIDIPDNAPFGVEED
jgi:hypothetical protein